MPIGPDGMPVKVAGQRRPMQRMQRPQMQRPMGGGAARGAARQAAVAGMERPMGGPPMGATLPPQKGQVMGAPTPDMAMRPGGIGSPRIAPINTPEMAGGGIAPGGATLPPQPPQKGQVMGAPTPDMAMRPGGIGSPRIAPISLPEAQQPQPQPQPQVQSAVPPPPAPPPVMGATQDPGMAQAGQMQAAALARGAGGMPPPNPMKMGMPPANPGMAQAGQMQAPGAPVMRPPMKAGLATGAAPGGAMPARPINYAAGLGGQRPGM